MAGWDLGTVVPYVAVGVTDASTFFYVGDDGAVVNNASPYAGPIVAAGAQGTWKRLDVAGEAYTAPGYIVTGRVRVGARL